MGHGTSGKESKGNSLLMHIILAAGGRLKNPVLKALYDEYKKRLNWKVTLFEVEGKFALTQCLPSYTIILDEKGDDLTSNEFARLLETIRSHHQGKVTFIIGGAEGLPQDIKSKANKIISFGKLTWPHLLVRVLLMEQLYRAQQILKGHPYHRE